MQLAGFHNRQGEFEKALDALTRWAAVEPGNPVVHYTISAYYWEKAYRDARLTDAEKRDYIGRGLQAADQAIALNPEYFEALTYKNLLLRSQALLESDPAAQKTLIAEADKLRDQAIAIRKARVAANPAPPTMSPAEMAQTTAAFLERQLADAKAQLAVLEQRYKENHPDVVRMRQIVRDLEAKAQMAAAASAASHTAHHRRRHRHRHRPRRRCRRPRRCRLTRRRRSRPRRPPARHEVGDYRRGDRCAGGEWCDVRGSRVRDERAGAHESGRDQRSAPGVHPRGV